MIRLRLLDPLYVYMHQTLIIKRAEQRKSFPLYVHHKLHSHDPLLFKFGFAVLSSIQQSVNKWWALDWKSECLWNQIPVKKRWPRCCFTLRFFTLLFTVIRQKLVRCGGHGNECGYRSNVKYTAAIISRWVECPKTFKPHQHQWTCYPGWPQASEKLVKTLVTQKEQQLHGHTWGHDCSKCCWITNLSSLVKQYNYKTYM